MNIKNILLAFQIFVSSLYFYKHFLQEDNIDIIDDFNYKTLYISKEYEYICLDLMKELYNKDLLIDTIYLSKYGKINSNEITTPTNDENINDKLWPSVINIFASSTRYILLQDINSISETFFFTTELLSSYITNNNKDTLQVNNEYKQLNNDIYSLSTIYCMNTFNIYLDVIDNNYLIIVGDNIDYYWIIYFLQTIETNIKQLLENTRLNKNKINRDILISLQERSIIIKNLVQELQLIVYYSFNKINKKLFKLNDTTNNNKFHQKNILFIKEYLNEIIVKLNNILFELYKFFPIQEKEKKNMIHMLKEKNELYRLDYNISQIQKNIVKEHRNNYILETHHIFINICNEISFAVETFIKGISGVVVSPFVSVIKSLISQITQFINLLVFSKDGFTIIGFVILVSNLSNIVSLLIGFIIQMLSFIKNKLI
jgi:hypothetical protein